MDVDNIQALQQAPPGVQTAQDIEVAKAAASADALAKYSDKSNAPAVVPTPGVDQVNLDSSRPGQSGNEVPASVQGPAPGSLGWHLANSFKTPIAQQPGGATKALFSGVTDALLHGNANQGDWKTAQSDVGNSRATQAPIQPQKKNIFDNVIQALADARGGMGQRGVLQGVIGTAGAMSDRQRQEQADKFTMAKSNSEMLHEQYLVHQLGEEAIDGSIKAGQQAVNDMVTPPPGGEAGTEDFKDKTSDELTQLIKTKQIDPSTQTVFATGKKLTGKDANGVPMYRTTYSVVTPPKTMDISPANAKLINETLGMELPTDGKLQSLPGVQANALLQRAYTAKANARALQVKNAKDQDEIDKAQTSAEARGIFNNTTVGKVISAVTKPGTDGSADPFTAVKTYNYFMSHPDLMKQTGITNFAGAMIQAAGGQATFDKQMTEYNQAVQKNVDNSVSLLDSLDKHPESMAGKTDTIIPTLEAIIKNPQAYEKDPAKAPELKQRAIDKLAIAQAVATSEMNTFTDKEKNKQKAQNEAELGDVDELIASAGRYDLDPEKQFGNRAGMRAAFMNKFLKETGGQWSERDYLARKKTFDDFRPEGKGGVEVRSLNAFAGHVGAAVDRIPALNNSASPDWNTAMNKIATKVGDEQYGRMTIALEQVRDEYLNFIKNQHAPTKEEIERGESILNPNMSPHQIHGIIAQMADTIGVRGDELQRAYTNTMRQPLTTLLSPTSDKIMQSLGVDTAKMKGVPSSKPGIGINRPADLSTATGAAPDPKTNKMYWHDASGKALREVKPGELPNE